MNCHKLVNIKVPSTYTVVENYVFKGVPLKGNTFNSKLTKIGIGSFQDCTELEKISIQSGVTSIGAFAYGNCTSLESVTFNNVSSQMYKLEVKVLRITYHLKNSLFQNQLILNRAALTKCTMPTTLTDANGIESSTINMFSNCKSLSDVTLPTNIKSLGTRMFANTSIETLYLPTSVSTIGAEALKDCTKLKYVNVSCTDPTTLSLNIFDNTPNLELLAVHGDLAVQMGEDMFGGKKLCYYGDNNPLVSKLCLDPSSTTAYVTKEFQSKYDKFGSPLNTTLDQFNGYDYQVISGNVCAFPGEPGLPIESESESESELKSELESGSDSKKLNNSEDISGLETDKSALSGEEEASENSDLPTEDDLSGSASDSGKDDDDDDHKKKKLSAEEIIGIVIGCLAFLALLLLLIIYCCKKHRQNNIETKDDNKDSSIALKKTPSKKDYESVDNLKDQQPEKSLMV